MTKRTVTPIESWPALKVGDRKLSAVSFERDDGMRTVKFTGPGDESKSIFNNRSTRVVYRVFEGEAMLLGVSKGELQKPSMGEVLINYFMQHIGDQEGADFIGTGLVHKPVFALSLVRAGLKPVSEDCLVEILPIGVLEQSRIPKIHLVSNSLSPDEMVDGSQAGKFYDVVNPVEVTSRYPIGSPDKTVAIHTRYEPIV